MIHEPVGPPIGWEHIVAFILAIALFVIVLYVIENSIEE